MTNAHPAQTAPQLQRLAEALAGVAGELSAVQGRLGTDLGDDHPAHDTVDGRLSTVVAALVLATADAALGDLTQARQAVSTQVATLRALSGNIRTLDPPASRGEHLAATLGLIADLLRLAVADDLLSD